MKLSWTVILSLTVCVSAVQVLGEQRGKTKRDKKSNVRTSRQLNNNADQMVQNILRWLQDVYSTQGRRSRSSIFSEQDLDTPYYYASARIDHAFRQGSLREYLPPTPGEKPRPFTPRPVPGGAGIDDAGNFVDTGYPPAGITPQPPFTIITNPATGGITGVEEGPGTSYYPTQSPERPGYNPTTYPERPGYTSTTYPERPKYPTETTEKTEAPRYPPYEETPAPEGEGTPESYPTSSPSGFTGYPSGRPTEPSYVPSGETSFPSFPTSSPSGFTGYPSGRPTYGPTGPPTGRPSTDMEYTSGPGFPTTGPGFPTVRPSDTTSRPIDSDYPTGAPGFPTSRPVDSTGYPTSRPTGYPTVRPVDSTGYPTGLPGFPTNRPIDTTGAPTDFPTSRPSESAGFPTVGPSEPTEGDTATSRPNGYPTEAPESPGFSTSRPVELEPELTPAPTDEIPDESGENVPDLKTTKSPDNEITTSRPAGGQIDEGSSKTEASPTDEDLKHPPHIHALEVQCAKDMMTINIEFNREFNGVIYSKGYYNMPECRYVNENSGQTKYTFTVNLNMCGTQFVNAFDTEGKSYLENVLVLQNEAGIQEIWDTVRSVRCLWEGNLKEQLSVTLMVGMLSQEIVTFSGDTAMAKLDVLLGRGPFGQPASGLVKIGEPMTLVVSVSGDPGFDVQVKDCRATDSAGTNVVPLTDDNGCILKPKLFGSFQKTRNTQDTGASIIAYAYFNAFKFPDVMDIMIECNIELCKTDCEMCPDPNPQLEPARRRRRDLYGINETLHDSLTMAKHLRVVLPEDLASARELLHEGICMSTQSFVLSSSILISLLTASCLISTYMWFKAQRVKSKQ